MTLTEVFEAALTRETEEEADAFVAGYLQRQVKTGMTNQQAKALLLHNLAYMAGLYSTLARDKIRRLFGAEPQVIQQKKESGADANH